MYLLDTNVLSELRKVGDGRADPNVITWLSSVDAANFYLSAISLMELELGILDAYIAATALVHGMTVVTRNVAAFESTGVRLLNPWIPTET